MSEELSTAIAELARDEVPVMIGRRLIDSVGDEGGFILSSGCSVPADIRPENFRAMIETGKHHTPR